MSACPSCGFHPDAPAPVWDAKIRKLGEYLEATGEPARADVLVEALPIPSGMLRHRWFRGRAHVYGIESAKRGSTLWFFLAEASEEAP